MDGETVVVLVHPGTNPRRSAEILRSLRRLLPTALLVVAPADASFARAPGVITLDADAMESGPLSVADAMARANRSGGETSGVGGDGHVGMEGTSGDPSPDDERKRR